MAQIFEKEWESIVDYDEQLKNVSHYRVHPEMMPFIGRNYPKTRILILGESHYVCPEDREMISDEWYEAWDNKGFKSPKHFDTRHVVNYFLRERRSKAHSMFRNPAKALIEAWELENVSDSEAFTAFSFMNYFQRPAVNEGKSIQASSKDKKCAYDTLRAVADITKPQKVIFLSKKAFDAFLESGGELDGIGFEWTYHPTSKYWNYSEGKEKIERMLRETPNRPNFCRDGAIDYGTANDILSKKENPYFMIGKKGKRFWENWIGIKVYESKESSRVSKIVWYYLDEKRRIGVGYIVKTRVLWIWDYDRREYLLEKDLSDYSRQILKEFKETIETL